MNPSMISLTLEMAQSIESMREKNALTQIGHSVPTSSLIEGEGGTWGVVGSGNIPKTMLNLLAHGQAGSRYPRVGPEHLKEPAGRRPWVLRLGVVPRLPLDQGVQT